MNKVRDLLNDTKWPNGKHEEKQEEPVIQSSTAITQYVPHTSNSSPDITLGEFIELFIDGWSSLFTSYNEFPPLNELLGYLVNTLNENNMLCFQKGGGGFSCYGQGKKVDFDAHLYYYGMNYDVVRQKIIDEFETLKQYIDARKYFNNKFELEIGGYTIII